MKKIRKALSVLLSVILPRSLYKHFNYWSDSLVASYKKCPNFSKIMRVFWKIVAIILFIPKAILELVFFIIRSVVTLFLPRLFVQRTKKLFATTMYACNELYMDLRKRGVNNDLAWKRFQVHMELFTKGREVSKSFGPENKDKTFFVIRPYYYSKPNYGVSFIPHLLTNYYSTLVYMEYALMNDYIPVVDWQNYRVPHSEETPVNGTMNAWEYYWNQPSEYTLEEVYRSKNVILSNMNIPSGGSLPPLRTPSKDIKAYSNKIISAGAPLAEKTTFNPIVAQYIDDAQARLFPPEKKILGVALRGTAYSMVRAGHHAVQPTIELYAEMIKDKMEEWGADYIFFTNEEEETVTKMKEIFGDQLLVHERKRYVNYHIYSDNSPTPTDEDLNPLYVAGQRYQTNLDYITEMALLSRCDCLFTALSNGIKSVLMWNGGRYENFEIIDLGIYAEAWEKK